MKPILEIQSVSKKFHIQHDNGSYLSLRDKVVDLVKFTSSRRSTEDFWALKDVSFDVMPGESVGIIGKNGAGKSTLLKILSKITPPTIGKIISRGRIASLLEVGTGFHPELSGRENIYLNGSILGMKRKEINSKFDEIVEFAGTEKFLDTPLKHYSSGMQLRLAFSVAAFLEPEILIIDEVLAVGDAEFQKKCMGKMEDVSKSGRTILFVSHNMSAIENLCQRGVLLSKGKMLKQGAIDEVIKSYQASFGNPNSSIWERTNPSNNSVFLDKVTLILEGTQPRHSILISCTVNSIAKHRDLFIAFDISNSRGQTIFQAIPNLEPFINYSEDAQVVNATVELPPLIPDLYMVSVWLGPHNTETICWEKEIVGFEIVDSPMKGRSFHHSHNNGFLIANSRIING